MLEIFLTSLKLGLTAFGGPVAHLGYFRTEFVTRRRWLDDTDFADLAAMSQFLPGPSSSQVGMSIGFLRAGLPGAIAAWAGFTLPSAVVLTAAGLGIIWLTPGSAWLHGLKLVAVPIVAQAIWSMARTLSRGFVRVIITLVGAGVASICPGPAAQIGIILFGALVGVFAVRTDGRFSPPTAGPKWSRRAGAMCLGAFALLMMVSPLLPPVMGHVMRATAWTFGGGHVVLPMLKAQLVASGLLSTDQIMTGYALAQAIPGPLFSVSAYYGAVTGGVFNAAACVLAAFAPALLLVLGIWPFWNALRECAPARAITAGVGAAVVGLLIAAFYDPVWTGAIVGAKDLALAATGFALLELLRVPPWAVVVSIVLLA